jgi:DNA polymerase-3 subunit gamma/tau
VWDIKYRPLRFGDVLGQHGTVQLLKARVRQGTALDTSYVFAGYHGSGKTTLARIFARAMSCTQLVDPTGSPEPCNECDNCKDVLNEEGRIYVEKDAASNGTIDHIRAIVDDLPFAVFNASKRIYTFDEAHRMSRDAQDVLLKPIEDKKLVAVFCTTEPEKIRGPIRSRCEEYSIRKITRDDVLGRLKWILDQEQVTYEENALYAIIDHAGAHVRDAVNRLEMVSQMGSITMESVREYLNLGVVTVYYNILLNLHDPARACDLVEKAAERASVDEIAAGIAEAAMNSYRLANNMHAEFTYVDLPLSKQVWERYGLHVLRVAEHFLRTRYGTKAALLSDVLILSQQPGNLPAAGAQPPVMFVVNASGAAPSHAPPPAYTAPPPSAAPQTTPPQTPPQAHSAAPAGPAPSAPVIPPAPSRDPRLRADGIGPLGADPLALTPLDHHGVAASMPRNVRAKQDPQLKLPGSHKSSDIGLEQLTPDEWRREFERTWMGRVNSG